MALSIILNHKGRFSLIKQINPCKAHSRRKHVKVINTDLLEISLSSKLILRLSCLLNKLVGNYLSHLDTVVGLVTVYLPFKYRLLRMELHAVEGVLPCLPRAYELLVV